MKKREKRFARDASRTCRTRDLKSSPGDAFSLNESRNEAPRQTLVTGFLLRASWSAPNFTSRYNGTAGDKSHASFGERLSRRS